jgi:hypothetical protein
MFALSGTEAFQRFRGSLRGESAAVDARRKTMLSRAVMDADGTHQSSRRAQESGLNRSVSSHKFNEVEVSAAALDRPRQLSSIGIARQQMAVGPPGFAAASHGAKCAADDFGVWDQGTLDMKLEKIQNLTRHHMRLLTMPEACFGSGHGTDSISENAFAAAARSPTSYNASPRLQHPFKAQITVLDQIDAIAVQAHRCVAEMRQRIEELATITAMSAHAIHRADDTSANGPAMETAAPRRVDGARQQPRSMNIPSLAVPVMRPHVPRLDDAPLRISPLKNRVMSGRTAAAGHRSMALWDGVPPLHACFVAIADGEWSHLLTVQQVKKEDVRSKCVSLTSFTAFLRHCKAFAKLSSSRRMFEQAFALALRSSGCAFDEHRVNFYGFCQVCASAKRRTSVCHDCVSCMSPSACMPCVFNDAAAGHVQRRAADWCAAGQGRCAVGCRVHLSYLRCGHPLAPHAFSSICGAWQSNSAKSGA